MCVIESVFGVFKSPVPPFSMYTGHRSGREYFYDRDFYFFNGTGSAATPSVYLITFASDLPLARTWFVCNSGLRAFLVV